MGGQNTHGMNGERVEWRWSERGEKPKQLASASQLPLPQDSDIECRARSVEKHVGEIWRGSARAGNGRVEGEGGGETPKPLPTSPSLLLPSKGPTRLERDNTSHKAAKRPPRDPLRSDKGQPTIACSGMCSLLYKLPTAIPR